MVRVRSVGRSFPSLGQMFIICQTVLLGCWWWPAARAGPGGQPRKSHRKVRCPSELGGWPGAGDPNCRRMCSSSEAESPEIDESTWKGNKEIISRDISWQAGSGEWKGLWSQGAKARHEYTCLFALRVWSKYPRHLFLAASEAIFVPLAIVWGCPPGQPGELACRRIRG